MDRTAVQRGGEQGSTTSPRRQGEARCPRGRGSDRVLRRAGAVNAGESSQHHHNCCQHLPCQHGTGHQHSAAACYRVTRRGAAGRVKHRSGPLGAAVPFPTRSEQRFAATRFGSAPWPVSLPTPSDPGVPTTGSRPYSTFYTRHQTGSGTPAGVSSVCGMRQILVLSQHFVSFSLCHIPYF